LKVAKENTVEVVIHKEQKSEAPEIIEESNKISILEEMLQINKATEAYLLEVLN
jgi:hypothetical protein